MLENVLGIGYRRGKGKEGEQVEDYCKIQGTDDGDLTRVNDEVVRSSEVLHTF